MPIDQNLLYKLTRETVDFLARVLPPRVAGISVGEQDGYRNIEIRNPFNFDHPITISAAERELTVEFGECHVHFYDHDGSLTEDMIVGEMVIKVVALVGGYEVSYSAWEGNRCLGGGWFPTKEDGQDALGFFPQADRLIVVGWEPWNNREIHRSELGGQYLRCESQNRWDSRQKSPSQR